MTKQSIKNYANYKDREKVIWIVSYLYFGNSQFSFNGHMLLYNKIIKQTINKGPKVL